MVSIEALNNVLPALPSLTVIAPFFIAFARKKLSTGNRPEQLELPIGEDLSNHSPCIFSRNPRNWPLELLNRVLQFSKEHGISLTDAHRELFIQDSKEDREDRRW